MKLRLGLLSLVLVLATSGLALAQSQTFQISRARVIFTSEAPLETINGVSRRASGSFQLDPSNMSSISGTITVPVRSLGTGIDERDEHLHSANWLDAGSHPNATFELQSVSGASSMPEGQDVSFQVRGQFTIHGQTNPVTAQVRGRFQDGSLRLRARFSVDLDDYGISIPSVVRNKVSNEISVQVDLSASAG